MKKYFKYKGLTVNAFGIPTSPPSKSYQKNSKRVYSRYKCFVHNFPLGAVKDSIVIYDFPNSERKERDWFRRHLEKFDYVMIQNSVWVGPSPLPKDFMSYVKSIGLLNRLRVLKLAKPYVRGETTI